MTGLVDLTDQVDVSCSKYEHTGILDFDVHDVHVITEKWGLTADSTLYKTVWIIREDYPRGNLIYRYNTLSQGNQGKIWKL